MSILLNPIALRPAIFNPTLYLYLAIFTIAIETIIVYLLLWRNLQSKWKLFPIVALTHLITFPATIFCTIIIVQVLKPFDLPFNNLVYQLAELFPLILEPRLYKYFLRNDLDSNSINFKGLEKGYLVVVVVVANLVSYLVGFYFQYVIE